MTRRPTWIFAAMLPALAGCGELREDGDVMCVAPVGCALEDQPYTCAAGDYPADTALEIRVWAAASPSEVRGARCWIAQTDEFELTVNSEWRERDSEASGRYTPIECDQSPKLTPGTWTIVFGDQVAELEIPSVVAEPLCLPSEPPF